MFPSGFSEEINVCGFFKILDWILNVYFSKKSVRHCTLAPMLACLMFRARKRSSYIVLPLQILTKNFFFNIQFPMLYHPKSAS